MNHGGLKNVVTEPTRLENKRERRRGAAGRAAVLRRAPSDSDCSGETASLSADSGDRAPRPPVQPPRSGKTRSRRRGSEWEVLEGLKDGQRFEKRPDVFNGYLHKKRKWPLKGWHKRFFVVDGGILVYARSPTDVARGRLHGSVDVGLSVISAKARRRRIDIDADEFIYHLRAKTPDVFRTWLNVLKTHRLYRQHLLTFGARESVPKIHAPLDDLPPTDTSSRTSTQESTIASSAEDYVPKFSLKNDPHKYSGKVKNNLQEKKDVPCTNSMYKNHGSLCSMHCVSRRLEKHDLKRTSPVKICQESPNISVGSTDIEKQVHTTDLDVNSLKDSEPYLLVDIPETEGIVTQCPKPSVLDKKQLFFEKIQAYYFFAPSKTQRITSGSPMKRSKKSTNLVKYKNFFHEPILSKPISKCILLHSYKDKAQKRGVACHAIPEKESNEVQVGMHDNESIRTTLENQTSAEYDKITQKLMLSLFRNKNTDAEAKQYIRQVIRELYDNNVPRDSHPIREMFRGLLDFWLKSSSFESVKTVLTQSQSIDRPSIRHFTKDKNISSRQIHNVAKETQFYGLSDMLLRIKQNESVVSNKRLPHTVKQDNKKLILESKISPRRDTESFERERKIQQIEKLVKDTVYILQTDNTPSKEKDIKITKTLIDNIGKFSLKSQVSEISTPVKDNSYSSMEKIQETINHLISETSISADVAKEFLSAYLDVLLIDDSNVSIMSTQSSEHSVLSKANTECDVQTEAIMTKFSKSVTASKTDSFNCIEVVDLGQQFLKDVLEEVTTVYSRIQNDWETESQNENPVSDGKSEIQKIEVGPKDYPDKPVIQENDDNSVIIDLTRYYLEHISMSNDPVVKGLTSIIIKLKENTQNSNKTKQTRLNLKFSDVKRLKNMSKDNWREYIPQKNTESKELFKRVKTMKKSYIPKDFDLKPYWSSSDVTSKAYKAAHNSELSTGLSFNSSNVLHKEFYDNDDLSYDARFIKNRTPKFQTTKVIAPKDCNAKVSGIKVKSRGLSPVNISALSIFERPASGTIDEKFILRLLENLTLLSKNIPDLHKEINTLYVKLMKKYQKIVNTDNLQEVNLLNNICKEDNTNTTRMKDAETQLDKKSYSICVPNNNPQIGTNTSAVKFAENTQVIHEILSAVNFEAVSHMSQTSRDIESKIFPFNFQDQPSAVCVNSAMCVRIDSDETSRRAATNPWNKINHYECVLDVMTRNRLHSNKFEIKKKKLPTRQEKFISPTDKVSSQSQTEKKRIRYTRDRFMENNVKVYNLYMSNKFPDMVSTSMSTSNIDLMISDDMKTLYRCSSGPSFCSS